MNLDKSLAFYKDRFADASDFTFVFVGSFDLPTIKPLVERYLGSLPSLHRKETGRDVGIRPPTGVVEKEVAKGSDAEERGRRRVHRPVRRTIRANRLILRAMANTLGGNLQRVAARGSRRHLRRQRRARVHQAADRGVPRRRSRSPAIRRARRISSRRCSRSIDEFKTIRPEREPGRRRAGGAAPGSRNRQPAERLPAEPAGVRVSVRRAGAGCRRPFACSTISCRCRC